MSHTFLKGASISLLAVIIVLFAISHDSIMNRLAAAPQPTGSYWNLDGGFGDSELEFFDGARYTDGGIGAVSVEGSYTVTEDRIVFLEYGPADAPCLHIPGTYKWSLRRTVLTLKEIDDKCPTRQFDWGSGLWIKQPEISFAE